MIKGIIFDLDDTLYPFEEYLESGLLAVSRHLGSSYGIDPEESYAYMKILYTRYGEREVLSKTVSYFSLDSGVTIELASVFREHKPSLALYPGYRKVLQTLSVDYALGLLADGDPLVQERKINALRIRKLFKHIVLSGKFDESKCKPNPFCFTLMARVMGLHPREMVYVADNPLIDFLGAKKAGMFTIRMETGEFHSRSVPMEFEANTRIRDLAEVAETINEYFQ